MRTRMWVFKYSLKSSEKHWTEKPATGMYAGLDNDSGGYPYPTDSFTQAHIWTDYDKAKTISECFQS